MTQTGGNWSATLPAQTKGNGLYELLLDFPTPGVYGLYFTMPALGLPYARLPNLFVQATAADTPAN